MVFKKTSCFFTKNIEKKFKMCHIIIDILFTKEKKDGRKNKRKV
jgi:hypothetical protein